MKESSKIKIPPPLVTLIFAFLMFTLAYFIEFKLNVTAKELGIAILCLLSFFLLFPAVLQFYQNKTTVNPLTPEKTKTLVIKGVYKYSRNPMYLGMALVLLAWCVYLENPLNLILFACFIIYMNRFQIEVEERALETLFGEDFLNYKTKVRRWI